LHGIYKKRKRKLNPFASFVLGAWFNEHIHYPFPTKNQKIQLGKELDITVTQIENYFSNRRKRDKICSCTVTGEIQKNFIESDSEPEGKLTTIKEKNYFDGNENSALFLAIRNVHQEIYNLPRELANEYDISQFLS